MNIDVVMVWAAFGCVVAVTLWSWWPLSWWRIVFIILNLLGWSLWARDVARAMWR